MNSSDCQPQLQKKYLRETWHTLLPQLLPGVEFFAQPQNFPLTNEREKQIATARRQFGAATLTDGKRIAFYEIDVAATKVDLLRNRVALRELIARCIDEVSAHAVLAFFVQPGNNAYRLTYAAKESKLGEDLKIHTEQTATRRFTYVLGPGETCRTAALRLAGLAADHAQATLADVTDAFSVEKLNKEFFDTYKQHYQKFCGHLLENTDATTKIFGLKLRGLDDKARDQALKPVRDFVKKLLGRLVFLHFLQKKGWLGCPATAKNWKNGDLNFIQQLFSNAPEADRKRFHSRRLVPLFFDTLNRERKDDLFAANGTRVPYLNGGLFERDFDGVEQIDFPAELFANLLDFFGQYNFTIDENDPDDHEIGIDPEMLGHIFENLLEDNKDKGAYYTPKAVVQYMCQQSLIHALAGHFPGDDARAEIEKLIRHKEPIDPKQENSWLATNANALEKILDDLNICDPAIGSGAFPIGLLQEIYWTKLTLHPALDRAEAKRTIIQRSVHGVDIDAGAVEIARLRFWLALIVEEKNPVPLPNLDYQIMQGNSLLESFEGLDLSKISEPQRIGVTLLGNDQVELGLARPVELTVGSEPQEKLDALQRKYFACHDPEKKARLRAQIDAAILRAIDYELELRRETLAATLENWRRDLARRQKLKKDYEPTAKELKTRDTMQAELDALADKKAKLHTLLENPRAERPFFLWHLWFRHILTELPVGRGGFDIVIANPPYVRHEAIKEQKPALQSEPYECFDGLADLLVYFYECAVKKLRPGGVLTFITSNKFYRSGYGEGLRAFLVRELKLHRLIDFGDTPVFDAIAYASILEGTKSIPPTDSIALAYTWEKEIALDRIEPVMATRGQNILQSELTPDGWRLESPVTLRLLAKFRKAGKPLGKYVDDAIYFGIKTGLNEAFIVDRATRDRLINEHPSSKKILKPFVRGRDVKKWSTDFVERFLIKIESSANADNPWSGMKLEEAEKVFAETYPAIYRWLMQFRKDLVNRDDQGSFFWELRSCVYWSKFEKTKILYPDIYEHQSFTWDTAGFFAANTCYIIPTKEKWLVGLLNSIAVEWFYRATSNRVRGGYLRSLTDYISLIPIPVASDEEQTELSGLVDRILVAKRAGNETTVQQLEQEIDTHVFRLYGLTQEEIALVQAAQPAKKQPAITERTLPKGKRTTLGGVKYAIQLVQALITESAGGLAWPRLVDAFTLATQPNLMVQETASADATKVKAWTKRWNENLPPGALITAIEQLGAANLAVRKSGNTWHISLKTEPQKSIAEDVNYDAWLALRVLGPAPEVQLAAPVFAAPNFVQWTNVIEALAA